MKNTINKFNEFLMSDAFELICWRALVIFCALFSLYVVLIDK
jgi:hypothetical protein